MAVFLVYLPPIQQRLVSAATQAVSDNSEFKVRIEHIALRFPLALSVNDTDVLTQQGDTLASVDELRIEILPIPLFRKEIAVNGIAVSGLNLDSHHLVPGLHLSGVVGELFLDSHGINITDEIAVVNRIMLSNTDLLVCYTDTIAAEEQPDTSSSQLPWKIMLEHIDINNAHVSLHILPDTLSLQSNIQHLSLRNGVADLREMEYSLRSIDLSNTTLQTDFNQQPPCEGFDANHIGLSDINVALDSIHYRQHDIHASIAQCSFRERSGLYLQSVKGQIYADSTRIEIPMIRLASGSSTFQIDGYLDWDALQANPTSQLYAHVSSQLGKEDLLTICHLSDTLFQRHYSDDPIQLNLDVEGSLHALKLHGCDVTLPNAFTLKIDGHFNNITDSLLRTAHLSAVAEAHDMNFLTSLTQGRVAVPQATWIEGECDFRDNTISAATKLFQHDSDSLPLARLDATYSIPNRNYGLNLSADGLNLHDFLPTDSIFHVTTQFYAHGQNFDFFSPKTSFHASGKLERLEYGSVVLTNTQFETDFEEHLLNIGIRSDNPLLKADATLRGILQPNDVTTRFKLNVDNLDWQALHFTPKPIRSQHTLDFDLQSNLHERHTLHLSLTDNIITNRRRPQKAKDLSVHFHTDTDSTQVRLSTGDLNVDFTAKDYVTRLSDQFATLTSTIQQQWNSKHLSQSHLRKLLPDVSLSITSGQENLIYNLLSLAGFRYDNMQFRLNADATQGLNSSFNMFGLQSDSIAIDTLYMSVVQDTATIHLQSGVINNKTRGADAFNATLMGGINDNSGQLLFEYLNAHDQRGVYLGLQADLRQKGIRLHFFPEQPTIMYRPFTFNKRNTIYLSDRGRIYGNVQLHDEYGTGLEFHTHFTDSVTKQDATLTLQNINLHEVRDIYPFIPHLEGFLGTELRYIDPATKAPMISADVSIRDFVYEKTPLGTWEFGGVYLPDKRGEHFVDAYMRKDDNEILTLQGIYKDGRCDSLKAEVNLVHFPLDVANPFVPDATLALQGSIDGTLQMDSPIDVPLLNGELAMNDVAVDIPSVSAHFAFCNEPLQMTDSRILFDNYKIYTHDNSNPFNINGTVDIHDVEHTNLDLRLRTNNYELINAKKTRNAMLYGKLNVDLNATLKGNLDHLSLRGRMNVLGKSDFTYVLANSPLQVEDRLGELVTFADFSQDQYAEEEEDSLFLNNSLSGFDILMTLHIDQAVRARVNLTPDGSNYMMLEGGGDLSFQYTPQGEMLLNGRYALIDGELKYDIPIIPLRTFNIKNGSYVQWNGPVLNPTLNITATERTRSSVGVRGQTPRMVEFDVGLQLKNQLKNPDMAFILSAPEDASVQDQIASMSVEEQNKMAVTMLVTGIYLAEGNTANGFNASNTLNAFLQSQISNIAGQAMEVNFDMNERATEAGTQTDYNFQFAKRFWNNRFRIVIGGTVSTGNVVVQNETFINNVSIEYRLDNSGTRNIKLLYDKNYQSILEGEITEMGLGVLLRKKVTRLSELFIFKKYQPNP
ncbi:MAG: translocation/assembly module TamB domain-containing protein [Bacteroidales bacterium]|nr:translocation/assembly module TamB domain-containing protein [Bacteroidales bacterium]